MLDVVAIVFSQQLFGMLLAIVVSQGAPDFQQLDSCKLRLLLLCQAVDAGAPRVGYDFDFCDSCDT